MNSEPLLVICLCAGWCTTCGDYAARFTQVRAQFPDCTFVWIDIEDQADIVDPVEVENFPTLLVAREQTPLFFGTVLPHRDTLERLVRNHAQPGHAAALDHEEAAGLLQRLRAAGLLARQV